MNGLRQDAGTRMLGDAIASLLAAPNQVASALLAGGLGRSGSGCEIPPPCWEPRPAGSCALAVSPTCAGTIRVQVVNCGWRHQTVGITAPGALAGWVTFAPTSLVLGPQERATILVTVHVPANVKGGGASGVLLVRGCVDHFVRVEVRVADCPQQACCDIVVKDCADNVHHWYDHFYCPRPCRRPANAREQYG